MVSAVAVALASAFTPTGTLPADTLYPAEMLAGEHEPLVGVITAAAGMSSWDRLLSEGYFNRGYRLLAQGRREAALNQFERGLAIDPDNANVLAAVARVLTSLGSVERAVPAYRRAIERLPDDRALRDELAGLLAAKQTPPLSTSTDPSPPQPPDPQPALPADEAAVAIVQIPPPAANIDSAKPYRPADSRRPVPLALPASSVLSAPSAPPTAVEPVSTAQDVATNPGVSGSAEMPTAGGSEPDIAADRHQRRAAAHALALQSDWTGAALAFRMLAAETKEATDRLSAMRALAQSQQTDEAIAEGERLHAHGDVLPSDEQVELRSALANLHEARGYRLRREGRAGEAAQAFERAFDIDPARGRLLAEAGYARLAAGDRPGAALHFTRAIDLLAERASGSPAPVPELDPDGTLRERLRREVREARRTWTLAAFQSWRPRGAGPAAGFGGLQRDGLIAAQGGAELSLRLPEMQSESGARTSEVFVRTLWSQRDESLSIDGRSVQGGVGLRWQPLPESALRLTAERLVAIGEDARSDWLVRLSWGRTVGNEPQPGRDHWPSGQFYIDVGRFVRGSGSTAIYAEARQGLAQPVGRDWIAIPHLVAAVREVRPDPTAESWAEVGAGLALRRAFGGTAHEADRGRFELSLQYRFKVSGAGRQGWLAGVSVLW